MRRLILLCTLCMCIPASRAQNTLMQHIDSLNTAAQGLRGVQAEQMLLLGSQATELASAQRYRKGIAEGMANKGAALEILGRQDEALKCLEAALPIFDTLHIASGIARCYITLGHIRVWLACYDDARENYDSARIIARRLADKRLEAEALNGLGILFDVLNEADTARYNFMEAGELYHAARDVRGMAVVLTNLGNLSAGSKNITLAKEQYHTADSLYHTVGDRLGLTACLVNIGSLFQQAGNNKEALKNYESALELTEVTRDRAGEGTCLVNIGRVYLDEGNYTKAEHYLKQGLELGNQTHHMEIAADALRLLANLYTYTGKHKEALETYKQFTGVKESLQNTDATRRVAARKFAREIDRERAERETETRVLQKTIDIKDKKLKAEGQVIVATGIIAILLIIIVAGAVYAIRSLRIKNASIRKLADEQEQIIANRTRELFISNTELKAKNEKLAHLNTELLDVVWQMSHMVRGPLSTILGVMKIMHPSEDDFIDHWDRLVELAKNCDDDLQKAAHKVQQLAVDIHHQ